MNYLVTIFWCSISLLTLRILWVFGKKRAKKVREEHKEEKELGLKESNIPFFGALISFPIGCVLILEVFDWFNIVNNDAFALIICVFPFLVYRLLNNKFNPELVKFKNERRKRKNETSIQKAKERQNGK